MNEPIVDYLVLVSMAKPNKATAQRILDNMTRASRQDCKAVWFDPAYIGVAVRYDGTAHDLWAAAVIGIKPDSDLRDLLIVQLGWDWCARGETPAAGWLKTHRGRPLGPSPGAT